MSKNIVHSNDYGNYRSASAAGLWGEAYDIANRISHPDERDIAMNNWWQFADLKKVLGHLVWYGQLSHDSEKLEIKDISKMLYRSLKGDFILSLYFNDNLLIDEYDFDLKELYFKWSLGLVISVLPIVEAWAAAYAPEHLYIMRRFLDVAQCGDIAALSQEEIELISRAMRASSRSELTIDDVERIIQTRGFDDQDTIFICASELLQFYNEECEECEECEYNLCDECNDKILKDFQKLEHEILISDPQNIAKFMAYPVLFSIRSIVQANKRITSSAMWATQAQVLFDTIYDLKILEKNKVDFQSWDMIYTKKNDDSLNKLIDDFSLFVLNHLRSKYLTDSRFNVKK